MAKKKLLSKLHQPIPLWVAAIILAIVSLMTIGALMFATPASSQLPHHFRCNEVQAGSVTLKPSLAARLFCYSPLHSLWYEIQRPKQQPSPEQQYQPRPTATSTPPSHTTYVSDKLGISFTYMDTINGKRSFYTREVGNKVFLFSLRSNQLLSVSDDEFLKAIGNSTFSVEVFNKDPQLSLTDAIKQQFLIGYSEVDCPVVSPYRLGSPREDMAYQTAAIKVFRGTTETYAQLEAKVAKCPKGYTESGRGVMYFMMDPKHPNKFLFVRVGQGNMPSGVGPMWDGTIKVLGNQQQSVNTDNITPEASASIPNWKTYRCRDYEISFPNTYSFSGTGCMIHIWIVDPKLDHPGRPLRKDEMKIDIGFYPKQFNSLDEIYNDNLKRLDKEDSLARLTEVKRTILNNYDAV